MEVFDDIIEILYKLFALILLNNSINTVINLAVYNIFFDKNNGS